MSSSKSQSDPYSRANFFSRHSYHWVSPLLRQSRQAGTLHLDDLYELPSHLDPTKRTDELESNWFDEVKRHPNSPSFLRATLRTLGWKPFLNGFFPLLNGILQIIQPLVLISLMRFFEPCTSMAVWHAWLLVLAIILIPLFTSLIAHNHIYRTDIYAAQIMAAYMGVIYRKVLRLSSHSMNSISSGEIMNLLANDANKIELMLFFINYLWVAPVHLIILIFVFWHFVKYIALIAIGYSAFLLCVQPLYSRCFVYLREKILLITDERVKIMSEVIKSMRIVKMYCWESAFVQKISYIRKQEIFQYVLYNICDSFQNLFSNNYTGVTFLMMYGTMWWLNIRLDLRFFAIASCIMGFMKVYVIGFFGNAARDLSNYLVAKNRIQAFLLLDESERDDRLISSSHSELSSTKSREIEVICDLQRAQWNKNEVFALKNISFQAQPGDLICIIGPVGCGKSSLLQTLTGEIAYFDGKVRLHGSYCYVPQEAWIFSSSIKENILFGQKYHHKLFQHVIQATALNTDFEQLSNGANTLVGDQGVMLSGGQKARVNMARALYRNADIYLLDDPLSAVDTKVSKHLFEKCIKGVLSDKICILVTHQIQFLRDATKILVLDHGEMVQLGTYDELLSSSSSFAHLLEDIHQQEQETHLQIEKQQSIISSVYSEKENDDESITHIDTKQEGAIKWNVYSSYIRAGFGCPGGWIFLVLIYAACQSITIYNSWWLARWSQDETYRYQSLSSCTSNLSASVSQVRSMLDFQWQTHRDERFYIYCGLVILLLILHFGQTFSSKWICLNAGRVLHNKMFRRVIRCPIRFFDMNPIGRILNRFTRDIDLMDNQLIENVPDVFECISSVLGTIVIVGILNPWSFIPAVLGLIAMLIIRYRFARCFRDLKRLEGATRTPVYSHLSSTIHGLKVIRSYHAEEAASRKFDSHLNDFFRSYFLMMTTERWAALRLDAMTVAFLSLVTVSAMLARIYYQRFSAADIALTLSYCLNLVGLFQWMVRQSVTVESQMTSVERVLEYCSLEQEPPPSNNRRPPMDWPRHGEIIFRNVSMAYSNIDNAVLALHNITLKITAGEKIGIVGRTGAGKSSFIQILFRMGILVEGQIEIDHIDIANIDLDDLRSRISIIPQDPVLFTGTIRDNLDQFHLYSDQQIWNALEEVQLKSFVQDRMTNGLDAIVVENGSNLSIGQKQLICLARAILRKSQILVIDEATANVDNATDELIQQAIRNKFRECTVLTVAHRLRTVIDSDRILVLGNGTILEFDRPTVLLSDPQSYFVSLVEQTGAAEAEYLRTLAHRMDTQTKAKQTVDDPAMVSEDETDPLLPSNSNHHSIS